MQNAVSQFCKEVKFDSEDVLIGARRHSGGWNWLRHIPLTGYSSESQWELLFHLFPLINE